MRRVLLLTLLCAFPARAELRQGNEVTIEKDQIVDDDLYVGAGTVRVLGTVKGDLLVAGGTVEVPGEVQGDLLALAGRVNVTGRIGGHVRVASGQLTLGAPVEGDVLYAGGALELQPTGEIGRDLLAAAGQLTLDGPVVRSVRTQAGKVTVAARVGGDLTGNVDTLELRKNAWVGNDVKVTTPNAVVRDSGATVKGELTTLAPPGAAPRAVVVLLGWLRTLIGLTVLALIWRGIFPGFSQRSIDALVAHPGRAAGYGALALALVPAIGFAAIGLGAVVGGWWLGMIVLGALGVAALISFPLVGAWLGQRVLKLVGAKGTPKPMVAELIGLVLLTWATLLPWLGALVALTVTLFGLGAQLVALPGRVRLRTTERLDQPSPPQPSGPAVLGSPS